MKLFSTQQLSNMMPTRPLRYKGLTLSILCYLATTGLTPVHAQSLAAAGDVNLSSQTLNSAVAGRDMTLNAVTVNGALSAGRNIDCESCSLVGKLSAGHDIRLDHCSNVQSDLVSGNNISLNNVTLLRNATAGNQILSENASIQGRLTLGGDYLKLDHSKTADIFFEGVHGDIESRVGNSVMITSHDNIHGSGSFVHVGPQSLSSVNGYTIKGSDTQTTVITPGQTIYVNAHKVSGSGPKNYAQYLTDHPEAPMVRGPGWPESNEDAQDAVSSDAISSKEHSHLKAQVTSKTIVNRVDLINHSVVNGQIVFENGYGQVRVYPGSQFNGHVVNGTVEKEKEVPVN